MQIPKPVNIELLKRLAPHLGPSVVALGNFDGVHIGHQALLNAAKEIAKKNGVESVVALTFDPHPSRFFGVTTFAGELQKFAEKVKKIQRCIGQEACVHVLEFNKELAELSPYEFCKLVLQGWLNARFVLVGSNFRFGKGRSGTFSQMSEIGANLEFESIAVEPIEFEQEVVSSSRIRKLISVDGFIRSATFLLGGPYEFVSTVETGQRLGRKLGFPTLNIRTTDFLLPKRGVYVVRASSEIDRFAAKHIGVMNVGFRPTVASGTPITTCEVHVIDQSLPELYGMDVHIQLLDRIRDEKRFSTTHELISAIKDDIVVAKNFDV